MNQQSAFDRNNIEETAVPETEGLLEQFNLPPAAISFIRKNQRAIWVVVVCVALAVVVISLYSQYKSYREEKASSALTLALQAEGDEKKKQLIQVVDEYGSTTAGLWSKIELAHLTAAEGDYAKPISDLTDVQKSISLKNPLAPLLFYNLAVLHEKNTDIDQALISYTELSSFKGFEKISYEAMGRLYEIKGSKAKALEMYNKYMSFESPEIAPQAVDPERSMIQARINRLEN